MTKNTNQMLDAQGVECLVRHKIGMTTEQAAKARELLRKIVTQAWSWDDDEETCITNELFAEIVDLSDAIEGIE